MQAYLLFGDEVYLSMFSKLYASAMHGLTLRLVPGAPADSPLPPPWLADADMQTGKLAQPWISSLSAFWPGLQALAGGLPLCVQGPAYASARKHDQACLPAYHEYHAAFACINAQYDNVRDIHHMLLFWAAMKGLSFCLSYQPSFSHRKHCVAVQSLLLPLLVHCQTSLAQMRLLLCGQLRTSHR